jgi:hypothetical protein
MRTKHQIVISKDNEIVISCTRNIKFEERERIKRKREETKKKKIRYIISIVPCLIVSFLIMLYLCNIVCSYSL